MGIEILDPIEGNAILYGLSFTQRHESLLALARSSFH